MRDTHFGNNRTAVNLKDTLANIDWELATFRIYSFNTIATLVYHINYYIASVTKVLQGEPLDASDSLSFSHPPIDDSKADWEMLLKKAWADAETSASLI